MKNLQFHLPLTDIHKSILSHSRLFSHESLFLHFGWEIHQHFQFRAAGTRGQGGFALLSHQILVSNPIANRGLCQTETLERRLNPPLCGLLLIYIYFFEIFFICYKSLVLLLISNLTNELRLHQFLRTSSPPHF